MRRDPFAPVDALIAVSLLAFGTLLAVMVYVAMTAPVDDVAANPALPISVWLVGDGPMRNELRLETATTPDQQRRGLMARDAVGRADGMAFPRPATPAAYWMHGTRMALDVVYVGVDGRVSSVVRGRPMDDAPMPSGTPAPLVIEVPAGRARLYGLEPGAPVRRIRDETR